MSRTWCLVTSFVIKALTLPQITYSPESMGIKLGYVFESSDTQAPSESFIHVEWGNVNYLRLTAHLISSTSIKYNCALFSKLEHQGVVNFRLLSVIERRGGRLLDFRCIASWITWNDSSGQTVDWVGSDPILF